nr:hypothetical protein [Gellertiella hungarica]
MRETDALTAASVTVAWVVALNKPFYPLYVWWLTGEGTAASLVAVAAAPFFAAAALMAKTNPLAARLGVPLIGIVDTVLAGVFLGQAGGTELYFAACLMLVALNFHAAEKWLQRGLAVFGFVVFFLFHGRFSAPLHVWDAAGVQSLLTLNAFSVASLMTFIALRYAGVPRG